MKINFTALLRSVILTMWFVVIGSIGAELYAPLKGLFTNIGGHHWTGKSIVAVAGFALCYLVHMNIRETKKPGMWVEAAGWSAVFGGLLIFAFFLWHFLAA
jgi:hypothetical protein